MLSSLNRSKNIKLLFLVPALAGLALAGQQIDQFEVASIKPERSSGEVMYFKFDHGRVVAKNVSLAVLICESFQGIHDEDQILNAPKWLFSETYSLEAKPETPDPDEKENVAIAKTQARLRLLLADRFQLKTHPATREVKGYALTIARQGAKFLNTRAPDNAPSRPNIAFSQGHLAGPTISTAYLANWLARTLRAPVSDKTGLTGWYTMDLTFAQEAADDGPSLFTALKEQLGLQLVPEKQTGPVLVIDHAERPSPN